MYSYSQYLHAHVAISNIHFTIHHTSHCTDQQLSLLIRTIPSSNALLFWDRHGVSALIFNDSEGIGHYAHVTTIDKASLLGINSVAKVVIHHT